MRSFFQSFAQPCMKRWSRLVGEFLCQPYVPLNCRGLPDVDCECLVFGWCVCVYVCGCIVFARARVCVRACVRARESQNTL